MKGPRMSSERKLDLAWVALVMAFKLLIVSRYFLELHEAHPRIRKAVYLFCYGMPVVVILTTGFRDALARLTGAALF